MGNLERVNINMNEILKYILILLIFSIISYLVITTIVDAILLGPLSIHFSKATNVKKYFIVKPNKIDIQKDFQCSGYSCAYVLRYFDLEIKGEECYKEMPNKMKNGYVYPKGIINYLKEKGIKFRYIRGNLNSLKKDLEKGTPIIVMIKVRKDKNWLHYVPLVGFDENCLYFAESLEYLSNDSHNLYNRKITNKDFLKLWNTSSIKQPFYKNTYFVIDRKQKEN
jgi:hypothetical protein